MTRDEITIAQRLINKLNVPAKKCLKEIYDTQWTQVIKPKEFGKKFKKAVKEKKLTGLKHLGIRSTGRCDEYERI